MVLHSTSNSSAFSILFQDPNICHLVAFFEFYFVVHRNGKTHQMVNSFSFLISRLLDGIELSVWISKSPIMSPALAFYYYFTPSEFFTPVLISDISLESEWHQVSSGLQDCSQYFDQCYQCSSLNNLDFSFHFRLFQVSFQSFGNRSKCNNQNWYHHHFHVS